MTQHRPIIDETWTAEDCERQFKREREQDRRARKRSYKIPEEQTNMENRINPRRTKKGELDDYYESDEQYVLNNLELCVELLDNYDLLSTIPKIKLECVWCTATYETREELQEHTIGHYK